MNISVTGASGDIGGAFLAHAASRLPIKALIRKDKGLRHENLSTVERFEFLNGLTYDAELLRRFTDSDNVLHCAGLLNTNLEGAEIDYFAVNALFTGLLVTCCLAQARTPKFVYISSEMVYALSASKQLASLTEAFVAFCKESFSVKAKTYDLRKLAEQFLEENKSFPYQQFNLYALTKYLGEAVVRTLPNAAIIRITSAYGPDYDNPRLIPRLIVARLTGRGITCPEEERDFVYSEDINKLIDIVIADDLTGVIDCKSDEVTDTQVLLDAIMRLTPTAYGILTGVAGPRKSYPATGIGAADVDLKSIIGAPQKLADGLVTTMHHHKQQCYHEMTDTRTMEDFLEQGEHIVEVLKGGSSAHIYVAVDKSGNKKVKKVAMRDGVEGNGVAKIASEIKYYNHIDKYKPALARMYPRLLDAQTGPALAIEVIEYLDGINFYAAIQTKELPFNVYRDSLQKFVDSLCACVFGDLLPTKAPEDSLDVYYVERALSRIEAIYNVVEMEDAICINGKQLHAPHVILTDLLHNKQLRRFIMPQAECFCFHGDLTLLNTVFLHKTHEIKMIDPRGYTGDWDCLYDFGKLKFTLSGFGEFILNPEPIISKNGEGYTIDFSLIPAPARKLNDDFLDMLADSPEFSARIISREPHWRYRVLLAEATHYLADIPFRLFTDASPWTSVENYIIGTYYLNQIYEALLQEPVCD